MGTAAITPIPTGTWRIDPAHSSIEFRVKHLGISTVRGRFTEFEGTLAASEDLASTRVYGTVKAASVSTNEPSRDEHLRSPDFFDVESHPEITFESMSIEAVGDSGFKITGDLALHGVTKSITLQGEASGAEQDPWGKERIGFEAQGELSRGDYGMTFNQALGSGNLMVSDKVRISIDGEAVKEA